MDNLFQSFNKHVQKDNSYIYDEDKIFNYLNNIYSNNYDSITSFAVEEGHNELQIFVNDTLLIFVNREENGYEPDYTSSYVKAISKLIPLCNNFKELTISNDDESDNFIRLEDLPDKIQILNISLRYPSNIFGVLKTYEYLKNVKEITLNDESFPFKTTNYQDIITFFNSGETDPINTWDYLSQEIFEKEYNVCKCMIMDTETAIIVQEDLI